MEVYSFSHDPPVKAGCCNKRTEKTYWMAETKQRAREEIEEETEDHREPHGLCADCLVELLAGGEYEIRKIEVVQ